MKTFENRRKPAFQMPAGACDAHCHVFGPGAVFPYAPGRRYTPEDAPKEELRALHKHLGIERTVIVQANCHGTDNRVVLDAIASEPTRIRGVAVVSGDFKDADYRMMHEGGIRGVRFNFVKHLGGAPDMGVFRKVLDHIKPYGWHVVLHVDAPDIAPLSEMIRGLPVPFVIDHMGRVPSADGVGQSPFRVLLELAKVETGWIKVSGSERIALPPYAAAIPFARALCEAVPDRVLWGTDYPHPNPTHEADETELVDLLPQIAPDPVVRRKLLVDNPARLYGF